jgi:hypothetical protein
LSLFALPRSLFEDWSAPTLEDEEEKSAVSSLDENHVEAEEVGGPYISNLLYAHSVP